MEPKNSAPAAGAQAPEPGGGERRGSQGEKPVCVITGGSSGMGLATARRMAQNGWRLVLAARRPEKLADAVQALAEGGGRAEAFPCDVADWASVQRLADFAAGRGTVQAVLHIAGMSPHMGGAEAIVRGNALGTVHIHDAFCPVIAPGGCLVDTSSMSAYLAPKFIMPQKAFRLAGTDRAAFLKKMMARVNLLPKSARPGAAYAISKYFVIWYARHEAARFGARGVRVLSVTPGTFETPMGQLEKDEAGAYLSYNAIPRPGRPEEIAALFAAVCSPEIGYLTGTDILCDGGCVAGRR